jgi:twitching motility protein PilT
LQLAAVLKAVISMRLVARKGGAGRVPAVEVLRSTPYIKECIENKEKTKLINAAIAAGTSQYGMQSFDQSLFTLLGAELITYEEALRQASNPDEFKLKVSGIQSASDMAQEVMDATLQGPSSPQGTDPHGADSPFEFSNS